MSTDRNVSVQEVGSGSASQGSGICFFGSSGMAFGALMAMLKANLETMSSMAELNVVTTNARLAAVNSTALQTQNMYNDDAEVITQQGNEQYATMASSFAQAGMGAGSLGFSYRSTKFATNMDGLAKDASMHTPTAAAGAGDPDAEFDNPAHPQHAEREALINKWKTKLASPDGITPEEYRNMFNGKKGSTGLDFDLGHGVTLRKVLNRAGNETDLTKYRTTISAGKRAAYKLMAQAQDDIKVYGNIGQAVAQGSSSAAQSQFKVAEADATTEKGAAAAAQSQNQAQQQFAQETGKAQQDQAQLFAQNAQQVWQTVSQMVQVDTRG